MFGTQKGITPVIAIVLLLLVTVGAVGVVYTQFQDLVGDGPDAGFLDADNVDLDFRTLTRNESASPNTIELNMINNDNEDFTFNTSEDAPGTSIELQYSSDGEDRLDPGIFWDDFDEDDFNCDDSSELDIEGDTISPGDRISCQTGMEMPSPGDSIDVHLVLSSSDDEITSYTCEPSTSSSSTC